MDIDVVELVNRATETSELILSLSAVREEGGLRAAVGVAEVVPLTDADIARLEKNGNLAADWSKVRVLRGFDPDRVRDSSFFGPIVLVKFDQELDVGGGVLLPSGIYNSTLTQCSIGSNALVRDVKLLSSYVVRAGAVLFDCGTISTGPEAVFGNGVELPIAIETGGREVKAYAEITVEVAAKIAKSRGDMALIKRYEEAVSRYVEAVRSDVGVIESGAAIRHTKKVADVYIGPYAVIDNAMAVVNTTILSNEEEAVEIRDGAYVAHSLVQWGSAATSMAIVEASVLTEHSYVERHGKVTGSLLGPNTGVGAGELTASLLGPFVGFHHQALLIAALWPEGKGNVPYGANIGSNHTSKAPDQEIWPGEGMFFGLGVNIKFPSDFTKSPYSIIASGVRTLPQKVTFPFSLINPPADTHVGISPARNEIIPAWVLTDNMFALKRNEGKYKARNKAKRTIFDFDVFRPEILDMMVDARDRLREVAEKKAIYPERDIEDLGKDLRKDIYTDRDIEGLGKNFMFEESRAKAVDAYTFYIRHYALLGLKDRVQQALDRGEDVRAISSTPSDDPSWEHQRKILCTEWKGNEVISDLKLLRRMREKLARDVEESKTKDDRRGRRIIEDYEVVHTPADQDQFVIRTWEETRAMQAQIDELLSRL
jgi:carbonic anhydrase/acetyltransferase-like protein (isoleucine patch superfamily)